MPRPHVSGDFCICKKYLRPHVAYTNRIRPSTRIRFVSGHLKGLVNRACEKRLVLILWRRRTQKCTDTSVHTYPDTQRIQKFPLWRAYTEVSGYTERIRRTRVDARCIRIKKFADTKISGYVCTGPKTKRKQNLIPQSLLYQKRIYLYSSSSGEARTYFWQLIISSSFLW